MARSFPATEQIDNGTNGRAGEEEERSKEQDRFQFKTGVALDPTTHSCPDTLDGKEFPARKDQAENPCNGPPYQEENADVWRERDNQNASEHLPEETQAADKATVHCINAVGVFRIVLHCHCL